jgi:Fe-S oxidoreductase/nitrate reductase gamma subunit
MTPTLAAQPTRETLWGMGTAAELLWYALALLSVVVFLYGIAREVAKYRRGHTDDLPPLGELWTRVRAGTRTVLAHRSIAKRDPYVGWAHRGIFYGWTVLFVGTVILALNDDVTERFFGWRFFQGWFYLGYSLVLDVLGLALIVGLLLMMFRRAVLRPRPRLDYARADRGPEEPQPERPRYRRGDWIFVGLLLYLVLTGYALEGVRIAMDGPGHDAYSPVGWACAQAYEALHLGDGTLGTIRRTIWWSHGLVAIAFVASIPYTKAAHMLSSWASLVLRDPAAIRRLRSIPDERQDEPAGYATLADFSVNHLLQLDACTKCGKCHEVCPARAVGLPLSPRDVVLELREQSHAQQREEGIGGVLGVLLHGSDGGSAQAGPSIMGEDKLRPETIWACMQCNACVEICPVGIEQAPIINQVRRSLVEEGELDANLQSTLQVIHKSGNSFGERARKRGRWTDELDFDVKDARKEPVDVLWFVGDYASFDPRSQQVSRALARLLHTAGVDFGILYDGERNAGNDVRRVGEEGLFTELAEQNTALLEQCDFARIVTTDPHSLNTLRNEYAQPEGGWSVLHHTTLLLELIESGRLQLGEPLSRRVTYHDPCHLGRMNGEYDNPRRLLELVGCELREMPRNREGSFCCGAGGGRIWIADAPGCERPSENRIHEALGLGELDYFVVSCPKDVTMYEDAIKTTGRAGEIALREVTELVAESVAARAALVSAQ